MQLSKVGQLFRCCEVQRHELDGDSQHWITNSIILSYHLFTSEVVRSERLLFITHRNLKNVLKNELSFEMEKAIRVEIKTGLVLATRISTQGTLPSKHRHYLATGCSLKCDTIKIKLQFSQVHRLPPPSQQRSPTGRVTCYTHRSMYGAACDVFGQTPLNLTPTVAHYHAADGCVIVK